MTNQRGDKVSLTPGTWIAFWCLVLAIVGLAITLFTQSANSSAETRERLVKLEVNSEATISGVQSLVTELKPLSERVGKVEARVERLEARN